jgi:hypothetical protein
MEKEWYQVKYIRIKWNSIKIKTDKGNIGMSVVYPHHVSISLMVYNKCTHLTQFDTRPIYAGSIRSKHVGKPEKYQTNENLDMLIGKNIRIISVSHTREFCELKFETEDTFQHSIDIGYTVNSRWYNKDKLWCSIFYPGFSRGGYFSELYASFGEDY